MGIFDSAKKKPKTDKADDVKIEIPESDDASPRDASTDNASTDDEQGGLKRVTENLARLEELLNQTRDQVTTYLLQKETEGAAVAAEAGDDGRLAEKLDRLAEQLDQLEAGPASSENSAGEQAAQAASEETLRALLQPLQEGLEQIDATLKSLGQEAADDGSQDAAGMLLASLRDGINQQHDALLGMIGGLQQRLDPGTGQLQQHVDGLIGGLQKLLDARTGQLLQRLDVVVQGLVQDSIQPLQQRVEAGLQEIADILRPEEPDESAGPAASGDWQRAMLGSELAQDPSIDFHRHQLLGGVLDGDDAACSLIGQLLIFRAASTDKMPQFLKDIGEAYYRWQPKASSKSNSMESALVNWLKETCADARIGNTIELVHSGERFDSARHTATTRGGGVEITKVLGWVVLRDNGRVYTKATVEVK